MGAPDRRREGEDRLRFVPVPAPTTEELKGLVQRIAGRIGRSLERSGLITRDIDNAYLAFDTTEESPILSDYDGVSTSFAQNVGVSPQER